MLRIPVKSLKHEAKFGLAKGQIIFEQHRARTEKCRC